MIIYRGAEAIIEKISENIILKKRIEKGYRIKALDEKIRKLRTRKEINLLKEVKRLGINVPSVLEEEDFEFKMEYINGKRLKDVINENNFEHFAKEIGKIVAKLHSSDIVHNDLTLSNFLFSDNKIYVIDFGLADRSKNIEKKAEDILTLYYSVKSVFPHLFDSFFRIFSENYANNYELGKKILERVKKILLRGRYCTRDGS